MIWSEWNNVGFGSFLVEDRGEQASINIANLNVEKREALADCTDKFDIGMWSIGTVQHFIEILTGFVASQAYIVYIPTKIEAVITSTRMNVMKLSSDVSVPAIEFIGISLVLDQCLFPVPHEDVGQSQRERWSHRATENLTIILAIVHEDILS